MLETCGILRVVQLEIVLEPLEAGRSDVVSVEIVHDVDQNEQGAAGVELALEALFDASAVLRVHVLDIEVLALHPGGYESLTSLPLAVFNRVRTNALWSQWPGLSLTHNTESVIQSWGEARKARRADKYLEFFYGLSTPVWRGCDLVSSFLWTSCGKILPSPHMRRFLGALDGAGDDSRGEPFKALGHIDESFTWTSIHESMDTGDGHPLTADLRLIRSLPFGTSAQGNPPRRRTIFHSAGVTHAIPDRAGHETRDEDQISYKLRVLKVLKKFTRINGKDWSSPLLKDLYEHIYIFSMASCEIYERP